MPLNVRRFNTSILLVLLSFVIYAGAQSMPPQIAASPASVPLGPPSSGDVMRDRISKAKAYIAVRNYHSAIFELEKLRSETSDPSVQGVVNVLLMNSYLEQGDYKRAQDMLNEFYAQQKTTGPNAEASYMAVAGQVVKGARSRAERYKALGLSVSDRTLPLEALNDLEKMRESLELVITQSKEMGTETAKAAGAMVMLEEASGSRSMLARDDYDSRRWRDELADTRERMAKTGSVVSAVVEPVVMTTQVAATPDDKIIAQNPPAQTPPATTQAPIYVRSAPPTPKESPKTETVEPAPKPAAEVAAIINEPSAAATGPLDVGSLLAYATSRAQPVYPPAAKTIRTTGVVKVEVTVNEEGEVTGIQKASGPAMLQSAAKDAVRKWKFKPFMRDGLPVKAIGFVSFNFSL